MSARRMAVALGVVPVAMAAAFSGGAARASTPQVLRVGTWNGIAGTFSTIQDAVNAAQPGDWILVGPGDYHEQGVAGSVHKAGVLITTPGIHLRGMNRNQVIVDGTRASAPQPCDSAPSSQDFGESDGNGGTLGRNGVEVWEADGVSVENLLACNWLSGSDGGNGNQIWWNGGDGGGTINLHAFSGDYLTASSSYNYGTDPANSQHSSTWPMGQYGIFTSNEGGPGVLDNTYASNMGDSSYYIGACRDCNAVLNHAHAENSALGFSGTNAGGHLLIENGEWDGNKAGIAPNTLNNDDWPSPADGSCPDGTVPCSIIRNNIVHDNNNPNAPGFGIAGAAPVGTGILLSGIRNYTVENNDVYNNDGWGVVVNDYPDGETPPSQVGSMNCNGGTNLSTPAQPMCYYPAFGNQVLSNTFSNNGGFGNPGNADIALAALPSSTSPTGPNTPGNCFNNNTDSAGTLTSDPPQIQTLYSTCGQPNAGWIGPSFVQLVCDSPGALPVTAPCPTLPVPVTSYPQADVSKTTILPIPFNQTTMPDPCAGVPSNPWCPDTTTGAVLPASAGGSTVASATAIGTPNTSAPGTPAAAGLAALGTSLGAVALLRRRRRGGSR